MASPKTSAASVWTLALLCLAVLGAGCSDGAQATGACRTHALAGRDQILVKATWSAAGKPDDFSKGPDWDELTGNILWNRNVKAGRADATVWDDHCARFVLPPSKDVDFWVSAKSIDDRYCFWDTYVTLDEFKGGVLEMERELENLGCA